MTFCVCSPNGLTEIETTYATVPLRTDLTDLLSRQMAGNEKSDKL